MKKCVTIMPTWRMYLLEAADKSTGLKKSKPGFNDLYHGVYWRKAKKKVQDKLGIDENAKKEVEEDVVEIVKDNGEKL